MKNSTLPLVALIMSAASLTAAPITIINNNFQNGIYNSNGSFEYDNSGVAHTQTNQFQDIGLWQSGDVSSLTGIDRTINDEWVVNTFTGGDGDYAAASVFLTANTRRYGLILDTNYDVQTGDTFNLDFLYSGSSLSDGWDTDDNLQVALFTSSDDTLGGTLTQVWAGNYLDTNGLNAYEAASEAGIGTIVPASVGQNLWIAFSAGDAGATNENEFMTIDNVQLTAIPEPGTYGLLASLLALGFVAVRRRRR